MPIELITGPANAGKAELVLDAVCAHLERGQRPLLVVPTRADALHYRRELALRGAVIGVAVERFEGLIAEVVRRSGASGPLLDGLARELVLTTIAARGGAPAIAGRGAARALGALIAELRVLRVSPRRLAGALARWAALEGSRAAAAGLGPLFEAYEQALGAIGREDREQQAMGALDALRAQPSLWGGTPVLFYGFDDLTRLELDAIETLGNVVDASVTVSLSYERERAAFAGRAAAIAALAPVASARRELPARTEHYAPASRAALGWLERTLFEPDGVRADAGGAIRLLEGASERDELELVAREIAGLLTQGMRPEEIAVVLRSPAGSADLLEQVLRAARIPHALERSRALTDSATGGSLIGLLRCAGTSGEGTARDLLAWLRAPGVLRHGELADGLEAGLRRAGAASAASARERWEAENWPLDVLERLGQAADRSAAALIDAAARQLEWLFAAPRVRAASTLERHERDEARAFAAARRALAELRELATLAPELAPRDPAELARALERVQFVSGEQPLAGAVAVVDPLQLRARRVRALFACRLQEGTFPALAGERKLLGDEERRTLAEASGLVLGEQADALAAERYLFYAAVSRPQQLLVLSWHAASDDGTPQSRSLFVEDVCDLFDDSLRVERRRDPGEARDSGGGLAVERAIAPLRDGGVLAELASHTWSASSLELWIGCPVRWVVERLLRARDLDPDPEPLTRGALAHAVLKDTFEGLRAQTGSARLGPERLELARDLLSAAIETHEPQLRLSPSPERRRALRRRLQADLERYLEHAACETELEPTHLELAFGFEGDAEGSLPALDLGEGVRLRGRIDRVDVDASGNAVTYDYKGRSAPPVAKWASQNELQVALYMGATERLLGLHAAGGFYQPLTGRDLRARGVLDSDANLKIECVAADARGSVEVAELIAAAAAVARATAGDAARGELVPRPQTCAFEGGCAFPSICRCEPL